MVLAADSADKAHQRRDPTVFMAHPTILIGVY